MGVVAPVAASTAAALVLAEAEGPAKVTGHALEA